MCRTNPFSIEARQLNGGPSSRTGTRDAIRCARRESCFVAAAAAAAAADDDDDDSQETCRYEDVFGDC